MTDRPIIFSAPMVRALLDGRKTQTRRLATSPLRKCEVGDRLYVRESFWIATRYSYGSTPGGDELPAPPLACRRGDPVHYAVDGDPANSGNRHYGPEGLRPGSGAFAAPDPYAVWVRFPSIHMPRWASRLTLIITDVRVEPLQAINEWDARAEGLQQGVMGLLPAFRGSDDLDWRIYPDLAFADLWDSLHGAPVIARDDDGRAIGSEPNPFRWAANPDVVALTFRVERGNIDRIAA